MGQDHLDPGTTQEITAAQPDGPPGVIAQFPLSFMQESLWFMDQVAAGTSAYNFPQGRRLRGKLNISALRRSLDDILYRHESLRTVFRMKQGQPAQLVLSARPFAFQINDLSRRSFGETELETILKVEAARPFDLKCGPLARATLFRLSPEDHLLLINLHHIICDQWSVNVFFSELAESYTAITSGVPQRELELPIQYADFAVWQRNTLTGSALQGHMAYWQQKLVGPLPALELATDHPRPPLPSYRGKTEFYLLSPRLLSGLKQISREQGATLFMTLLASFKLFLHRYCRQADILVGSPLTRRDREELHKVIGFFVNTHALRTSLEGDPRFAELQRRVRETVLGAEAHQDISLDQVVRTLRLEQDLGLRSPVQVICALQPPPLPEAPWGELAVETVELDNQGSKFDWSLLFTETSQGLQLRCEYSTDLFEPATVTRRMRHFETLLTEIVTQPGRRLSQFPLLTEAERVRLLPRPQVVSSSAEGNCLHERFEQCVASVPQAAAVTFGQESWSYGDLNSRSNRLAHYLRQHNVGPETRVALFLERSFEQVMAIVGVLKAGGAYVPIDPGYPDERLKFIVEDTEATVILTQASLRKAIPQTRATVICLDSDWPAILGQPHENPIPVARPENAAYIIYTSGSTGKPKGVVVTHHNVMRLFSETASWFGFHAADTWCLFHSYTFDFSVWELWGALLYGARLVVVPFLVSRSPLEFLQLLEQERVSVLNQTPSAFRQLMWAEERSSSVRLPSLRYVIFGGEALELQSLRPWFARHGAERPKLINMYGITETTVHVTYKVIRHADLSSTANSLIGVPLPDLRLYLLDEHLQPVPVGVPGEIVVGGPGVARGYLNRPELTDQRFIPDPFGGQAGGRLYRSGDLARYTSAGELEYLGRLDDQVKIRGFRIELGEIESALNRHVAVKQSLVLAQAAPEGGQRLVAYVVAAQTGCVAADLRDHLSQRLPDYMIPSAFVFLDTLPLTLNGKVDRRALPMPPSEPSPEGRSSPPRNHMEKLAAEIWSELLGRPITSIHANFFHLGGHSLLATQVMSRLGAVLGRDISVRLLFESPTVATLAQAIEHAPLEQPGGFAAIPRRIRKVEAEQLLAQVDRLSPAEIDALLHQSEGQSLPA